MGWDLGITKKNWAVAIFHEHGMVLHGCKISTLLDFLDTNLVFSFVCVYTS